MRHAASDMFCTRMALDVGQACYDLREPETYPTQSRDELSMWVVNMTSSDAVITPHYGKYQAERGYTTAGREAVKRQSLYTWYNVRDAKWQMKKEAVRSPDELGGVRERPTSSTETSEGREQPRI